MPPNSSWINKLLTEISARRVLWDPEHEDHKTSSVVGAAWDDIATKVGRKSNDIVFFFLHKI